MAENYDVIIIGSGAGGGTLALELAPFGKKILILERGGWLPREKQNWDAEDVFVENRYVSKDIWYTKDGKPFQPGVYYHVGGATKMYGAQLYRLRERDFGELRHQDGLSPAWPISYAELEPYYTRAENLYQVHGNRGEDPIDPPASAPYPHPAVSHEPRIQQLHDDLARAGYQPFHAPCGIMLTENNMPFSTCVRCAECDGFPCLVHAKSDAEVIAVRPALTFPNVTLLTNARATRLKTNAAGTAVTEVEVERDGVVESYRGQIVVVSCGASNSARLLLASSSDKHPRGLANGSDQVGRNYMCHNNQVVMAVSKEPNPTRYQKTLGVNDFYFKGPARITRLATSRWSASRRRRCSGARSTSPSWRRCGRWRCWPSTGSTSGSAPRTCRGPRTGSRWRATAASVSATPRPTRSRPSSSPISSSRCWGTSGCTRSTWSPATST